MPTPPVANLGTILPLWSVLPFVFMLLSVALFPLIAPHTWEDNRWRGAVAALLGVPVIVGMARLDAHLVAHTAHEYVAFVVLLGSLYLTASGIVLQGSILGRPRDNVTLLALGAMLASVIGTTGASMLLIRPLLRANASRLRQAHTVVFFIFVVSNVGGLLTPLGDPPLFLGFLRGVPFGWPSRLWPVWALCNTLLIGIFWLIDTWQFRREPRATLSEQPRLPLRIEGSINAVLLAVLIAVLLGCAAWNLPAGCQEAGMVGVAVASWLLTPQRLRRDNAFSWDPLLEVTIIFAGVFATMMPALAILNARGADLGLTQPWQFFWLTGLLSSLLDNAPTYLTFTATASALLGTNAQALGEMVLTPAGEALLRAISLGAVMMGANTYIGNGPNFMVKAIAEKQGILMPNFFGYMAYSAAVLVPMYGLVTWLFIL